METQAHEPREAAVLERMSTLVGVGTRILVADDEPSMRLFYRMTLQPLNFVVDAAADGEQAITLLKQNSYDLIITDLRMPVRDGFDVLHAALERNPKQLVVVATSYSTLENAIRAVEEGAHDFIAKPFGQKQLELEVAKALAYRRLVESNQQLSEANANLRNQLRATYGFDQIVGTGPAMQSVFRLIERISDSQARVLIYGESGTGKEVIARAIHANSRRAEGPFVAVNCGAIPDTLIESELFGHEKGSFTGATAQKKGLIEEAQGGTLFLDEVAEMAPAIQVKFLRFLQEGTYRRVGSAKERTADVRILAATNKQPEDAVASGKLREDLYYRLNVIRINLPSLSVRPEDVRPLVHHFIKKHAQRQGRPVEGIVPAAMHYLQAQRWPGNVRELENVIERAVTLSMGTQLTYEDVTGEVVLPDEAAAPRHEQDGLVSIDLSLPFQAAREQAQEMFDKVYLSHLLMAYHGNISRAARASQFDRRTLQRLIARYDIEVDQYRNGEEDEA